MGFITPVFLNNDAFSEFEDNPKGFGNAILKGVEKANAKNGQTSVGLGPYFNHINVEKSRHADHHVLFLSMGNCVTAIGAYEQDWEELAKNNPELAQRMLKEAQFLLNLAKERFKPKKTKSENKKP